MICEPHRSSRHQNTFAESRRRVLWLGQQRRREYGITVGGEPSRNNSAPCLKSTHAEAPTRKTSVGSRWRGLQKSRQIPRRESVSGDALRRKDRGAVVKRFTPCNQCDRILAGLNSSSTLWIRKSITNCNNEQCSAPRNPRAARLSGQLQNCFSNVR